MDKKSVLQKTEDYFYNLNHEYLKLHRQKEDLFWCTYMGTSDDHDGFAEAESLLNDFISSPQRITQTKEYLATLSESNSDIEHGLKGWLAFFEANSIESESGRKKMAELIKAEANLFAKRQQYKMTFIDENNVEQAASLTVLAANISNS